MNFKSSQPQGCSGLKSTVRLASHLFLHPRLQVALTSNFQTLLEVLSEQQVGDLIEDVFGGEAKLLVKHLVWSGETEAF